MFYFFFFGFQYIFIFKKEKLKGEEGEGKTVHDMTISRVNAIQMTNMVA